jgi:hypothetical protein
VAEAGAWVAVALVRLWDRPGGCRLAAQEAIVDKIDNLKRARRALLNPRTASADYQKLIHSVAKQHGYVERTPRYPNLYAAERFLEDEIDRTIGWLPSPSTYSLGEKTLTSPRRSSGAYFVRDDRGRIVKRCRTRQEAEACVRMLEQQRSR